MLKFAKSQSLVEVWEIADSVDADEFKKHVIGVAHHDYPELKATKVVQIAAPPNLNRYEVTFEGK